LKLNCDSCPGAVNELAAPPPGPVTRVQVDVVRHLVVGVVLQVELDRVPLAHADEAARHVPPKVQKV
jgi:hypothetical protein